MTKISAHIPTQQYGFIELSELPDDVREIERLYNRFAESPISLPDSTRGVKLQAFVGGSIYYDEVSHSYTNEAGEVYLSGSVYANTFRKPFDKTSISSAIAKKFGVSAEDIVKMWELKGEASRDLGNAIHKALQLYEQYGDISEIIGKGNTHDHSVLKTAVEGFYVAHKDEKAMSEVLVVDHALKHAGQIDRLLLLGNKKCRVQDFKTTVDIKKELPIYWRQLEFYGHILEADGWTVEGYDIFQFNNKWDTYTK